MKWVKLLAALVEYGVQKDYLSTLQFALKTLTLGFKVYFTIEPVRARVELDGEILYLTVGLNSILIPEPNVEVEDLARSFNIRLLRIYGPLWVKCRRVIGDSITCLNCSSKLKKALSNLGFQVTSKGYGTIVEDEKFISFYHHSYKGEHYKPKGTYRKLDAPIPVEFTDTNNPVVYGFDVRDVKIRSIYCTDKRYDHTLLKVHLDNVEYPVLTLNPLGYYVMLLCKELIDPESENNQRLLGNILLYINSNVENLRL